MNRLFNGVLSPKISVIVPLYNQQKYLGRCLRSLISQKLPHDCYEIIVINDGSTDFSTYALSQFCSPNERLVKVITNDTNIGLSASLNKGIESALGSLIVRVDSDDFVNENFLNFLFYYLENNAEVDAVGCDYLLVDDSEEIIERCNFDEKPIACGIMFRKEQLIEIGLYDASFRCQEERELRIRFEIKYKIKRLELPLYRYRRHDNNITNNYSEMEYHDEKLKNKYKS